MNITDYINTTNIHDVMNDLNNWTFQNVQSKGLLGLGFNPYMMLMGDFFWGLTFGIIAVAVYSWRGIYPTIGFLAAVLLITSAVIPLVLGDMFVVFLGFLIASVLYEAFVVKKKDKEASK